MKYFKLILLAVSMLSFGLFETAMAQYSGTGSNTNVEYVEGYTKSNGTYVNGYYRTKANSYNLANFSAKGNYNPYTGDTGTKTYDSPYNSYSSTTSTFNSSYSNYSNTSSLFDNDYSGTSTSTFESNYSFDFEYD